MPDRSESSAARRHAALKNGSVAVMVWCLVVAGAIGGKRPHSELLLVFGAGTAAIGLMVLAVLRWGGAAEQAGVLPGSGAAYPSTARRRVDAEPRHEVISSGLFERHPELRPREPGRGERAVDRFVSRLPGPSARSRVRRSSRRSAWGNPRLGMITLPLYGFARVLILCGMTDAIAVATAIAVGLVGAGVYYLRPTMIRGYAQTIARRQVRRGVRRP